MNNDEQIICPGCAENSVLIDFTCLGRYRCVACGHSWIEDPRDEGTWAPRKRPSEITTPKMERSNG